ncbi:alpha/beta hydrolase [Streptomyces sp. NPDC101151]|uniref:alpha/beta hydrolase n=1 Tax=Streptomyces sp. NPDC101151 TaxID=3366115 RepID=UPI00381210CB
MATGHEHAPVAPAADRATAALVTRRVPPSPRAAVLFLHGGKEDSRARSRPWQPAALRMKPFIRAVAAATRDDGILLAEVRYRVQGWNGHDADPVQDAQRALAELGHRFGRIPTVLVGHSMGGRAALRAAAAPQVCAVLALAPWCPDGEPVAHLRGKSVIVLHGERDRVTDPHASVSFAQRAGAAGARTETRLLAGGDHAMLRHIGAWHRTASSTVVGLLAARPGARSGVRPPSS